MMKTSKELIAYRDQILATPKHLREFEETCWLRGAAQKIAQAVAAEAAEAARAERIRQRMAIREAMFATIEYGKDVESRKSSVEAVVELYLLMC